MMIHLSTVRRAHHPGSRSNYLQLRDNRRHRRGSLVVNGEFLLNPVMSMGINGTLLKFNKRIDVVP